MGKIAKYEQMWRELAQCKVKYPDCCDVIDNDQWLNHLRQFYYLGQLDVTREDLELADRVMGGYIFHDVCNICFDYIMGSYLFGDGRYVD